MTKITDDEAMVLAGILARSNMGHGLADAETIAKARRSVPKSAASCAVWFCEAFMETNEHERIFTAEVRMWFRDLRKLAGGMADARALYPDIIAAYEAADPTRLRPPARPFRETERGQAFIASADSRETSPELMAAIAFFARDLSEAERLWNGDGLGVICHLSDLWENVTGNGARPATDFVWGAAGSGWFRALGGEG